MLSWDYRIVGQAFGMWEAQRAKKGGVEPRMAATRQELGSVMRDVAGGREPLWRRILADSRVLFAQAGAGAARTSAMPCQVVRPSSRRGAMWASAAARSARLARLWTGRKSSTWRMIARAPEASGA